MPKTPPTAILSRNVRSGGGECFSRTVTVRIPIAHSRSASGPAGRGGDSARLRIDSRRDVAVHRRPPRAGLDRGGGAGAEPALLPGSGRGKERLQLGRSRALGILGGAASPDGGARVERRAGAIRDSGGAMSVGRFFSAGGFKLPFHSDLSGRDWRGAGDLRRGSEGLGRSQIPARFGVDSP